jgi:hypothetical protein
MLVVYNMSSITVPKNREYLLDAIRGILLVIMTVDHTRLFYFDFIFQPIGAFSAAEGFVFLSGFVYVMVYTKYEADTPVLISKLWSRMRTMYTFHILLFVIILAEHAFLVHFTGKGLRAELGAFLTGSPWVFVQALTLTYLPYMFNLIPLYILYFAFGYFILKAFNRGRGWLVLVTTGIVWGTIVLLKNPYFYIDMLGFPNLSDSFRVFNPLSWFFLFAIGSYFGFRRNKGKTLPFNKFLLFASLAICIVFFLFRRVPQLYEISAIKHIFNDRSLVSPFRLINFLAFTYLISWIVRNKKLERRNFLAFIGQYSIYVYIFHIFIIYNLQKMQSFTDALPIWAHMVLLFVVVWSLTVPAFFKETISRKLAWKTSFIESFMYFPLWLKAQFVWMLPRNK